LSISLESIKAFLHSRGVDYVDAVRVVNETNTVILDIPRSKIGATLTENETSKNQVARLSKGIADQFAVKVVVAYRTSGLLADVESGLRARLQIRFPDFSLVLVVSFQTSDRVDVWISVNDQVTIETAESIRNCVEDYLRDANFSNFEVEIVGPDRPKPPLMAILRALKVRAPVEIDALMEELHIHGFDCPDRRWLSARLDGARKRELVVRTPSGKYMLSTEGLSSVPVSRRRSSSDIERILALGKRKKW